MSDPRRGIPSVDRLLADEALSPLLERYGRERVRRHLRERLDAARSAPAEELDDIANPLRWAEAVDRAIRAEDVPALRRVVNATGVVLHTNLGRAPLPEEAISAMEWAASGYTNLEFDLGAGRRGSRYEHCAALLTELTGAEAALVVNNAAAGLLLALSTFATGRGVVVSRGELVEIGGGFRIPEILERSGARLIEVGSTNRTRLADYREAVETGEASAILKVHRSNFEVRGFTEEATVSELVGLARDAGVPLIHDLGSGLMVDPDELGLPAEPRVFESLDVGADIVIVSGDKLFGGPQAGIVLGTRDRVTHMRTNPLCRALRVDKVTLAALEATVRLYRMPERVRDSVPILRMLSVPEDELRGRAEALAARLHEAGLGSAEARPSEGRVGGGTYPGVTLRSWAVAVRPAEGADTAAAKLRASDPPVVARIEDDELLFDLRTVFPAEELGLLEAILAAVKHEGS